MSVLTEVERLQEEISAATSSERPEILPPLMDGIREELRKFAQWVVWEAVWEDDPGSPHGGRWLKIPHNAADGSHASSTDPATWNRFETAVAAYENSGGLYAGIGFVLQPDDPFTIVVVDGAVADDNTLLPEAERIVHALKSYTELTAEGRGIQMFLRANLPPGGRRRGPIEMHESDGFLPLTGRHFEPTPLKIQKRQADVEALHADVFPPPSYTQREKEPRISPFANSPAAVNDKDLMALAYHTANGPRIEALYMGKTSSINGDRNAADLALCSMLGFYTGDDPMRLDRLFRHSALYREKWDVPHYSDGRTYGQATVAKALEGCIVFYTPSAAKPNEPQGQVRPVRVRMPRAIHSTAAVAVAAVPTPSANGGGSDGNGSGNGHEHLPTGSPDIPEDILPNDEGANELYENGGTSITSPTVPMDRQVGQQIAPFAAAEAQGRAQGLAINERVLTAQEAAKLLKISVRLLRDTIKPWKRFGAASTGDRWLLSDLLDRDLDEVIYG